LYPSFLEKGHYLTHSAAKISWKQLLSMKLRTGSSTFNRHRYMCTRGFGWVIGIYFSSLSSVVAVRLNGEEKPGQILNVYMPLYNN